MTAVADPAEDAPPKKKSKLPLILGVVLALAGGGGGFFAVSAGLVPGLGGGTDKAGMKAPPPPPLGPVSFVALDPLVVNLAAASGGGLLRFGAQLEVPPDYLAEVEAVKPRIVDVLNGYLRAVETADLADPTALMRLRSQMLRRVQVVTGEGRVRDLLIMEFVIN